MAKSRAELRHIVRLATVREDGYSAPWKACSCTAWNLMGAVYFRRAYGGHIEVSIFDTARNLSVCEGFAVFHAQYSSAAACHGCDAPCPGRNCSPLGFDCREGS
ncbi:hypothetical protein GMORB2_1156 [Geosmithia morbida]|uniref:Uncharacterized protein n=1 Tax=Geosmithia morbida TaxID=1094350 RepID=A0A9P4YZR1_9HYPO|nr:uncharacterized protein GMORB2_1156 [Geosmithia morbida]KAF4125910.1 hypothetical protein GMORB2_1156 [Geosmithia morbida]